MNLFDRIPTRKPRTKKEMIEFLAAHFRYHTLRIWNRMTSYAHNVKIYNLPWKSKDAESKAYDLISTAQAARIVQKYFDEFNRQTGYRYSIIANGRSGGYFVLVESERTNSGYKSECPECGQLNYRLVPPNAGTLDTLLVRQLLKGWTNETILREPAVVDFAAPSTKNKTSSLACDQFIKIFPPARIAEDAATSSAKISPRPFIKPRFVLPELTKAKISTNGAKTNYRRESQRFFFSTKPCGAQLSRFCNSSKRNDRNKPFVTTRKPRQSPSR